MFIPETCISKPDDESYISKIAQINQHFKLPIHYNPSKMQLNQHIVEDLELVEAVDPSGSSMYSYAFKPTTAFGKKVLEQMPQTYTTDTHFLKETQQLLKSAPRLGEYDFKEIMSIWDEIKGDTGFKERYHYVDWQMWEFLNHSTPFLQFMSIYNLASPLMSLIVPVIILIIPFFVIQLKGLSVNFTEYIEILKLVVSNHSIGRLFTQFNTVKTDEKIYLIISAGFYLFSIYQNFLTCFRFHQNLSKIHTYLSTIKNYILYTEESMSSFICKTKELKTYCAFNEELVKRRTILISMRENLEKISPYKLSIQKVGELGHVLQCFYQMHTNIEFDETLLYSFGYHGFMDNLQGISQNSGLKPAKFIDKKKRNKANCKKMYYPSLIGQNKDKDKDKDKIVKNDFTFKRNSIITGPNASGKTTILKSVLINIILTQQMGVGFYQKALFVPFKHIHCYLNIPDTSGRDSLFQAEARRCKEILDIVMKNKNDTHFCAFDELYSGTNPEEAVMSALAFMKYLMKYKNTNVVLTTHFHHLCDCLDKDEKIENLHMEIEKGETDDFDYKYALKKGISRVRGGVKVLYDMEYPEEIIENTKKEMENRK